MSAIDWATSLSIKLYERKFAPNQTKKLSNEFTYLIQSYLTPQKLKWVRELNSYECKTHGKCCHTHDFCDPNELMFIACDQLGIDTGETEEERESFFNGLWADAWEESYNCNFRLSFLPRIYYSLWNFSKWGSFTTDPEIEVI